MTDKQYTIGIDIGTTSTKAVLYDPYLNVLDSTNEGYDVIQLEDGMAEQNPEAILQAVLAAVRGLMDKNKELSDKIRFLSFSSAMHSVIFLDKNQDLLTNCIIWADNRSADIVKQLKETTDWKALYKKTGTPVHSMTPLSKVLWLKETRPEVFAQTEKIIGIKEYVLHKLTGEFKVDYSLASATGLFNIHRLEWDEDILAMAGIDKSSLPETVDVTHTWEGIDTDAARQMHIAPDTAVVIGASDGCLSNLGVGAVDTGETAITIGTSGAIRMVTDRIVLDPEGRTFCYYLSKNRWVIGGAVNNGGNVMSWLSSVLYPNGVYGESEQFLSELDQMNRLAEKVPAGADKLFFYPYINGERAPLWDPEAKGSYVGLSSFHKSGHMVRAAMEGALFNLYKVWQIIQEVGGPSTSIKATGGFLNSALWKQMLADIFGQTVYLPEEFESSCLGAVLIGLDGTVNESTAQKDALQPNPEAVNEYRNIIPLYQKMGAHIREMNNLLTEHN